MDELYIYITALVAVLGVGGYLLYPVVLPLFESDQELKERLAKKVSDVMNNADTSGTEAEYVKGDSLCSDAEANVVKDRFDDTMWKDFMNSPAELNHVYGDGIIIHEDLY